MPPTTTSSSNSNRDAFGPHVGLGKPAVKAPPQASQQMVSAVVPADWTSLWPHRTPPAAGAGWLHLYWAQQAASLRAYDLASCALKVFLLIGNVKRSADHKQMLATCCAAGAAVLCAVSFVFMWLCHAQSLRYRRLVMWSNLAAISIMMANSMPQFLSAVPISWLWGHRALILLFKMGVTWPMMAALMHRLPWQDLAVVCGCFCLWLCATWVRPLCTHLQSSPADAAFIQSLGATLDRLTGLSASSAAVAGGFTAAVGTAGGAGAAAGAAVGSVGLQEEQSMPLANRIAAACMAGASNGTLSGWMDDTGAGTGTTSSAGVLSGPECESLLLGQCMAVVTSLTLWVGVLLILFCVVLAEQHSKWRWWHSSAVQSWQQGRLPTMYAHTGGTWAFLGSRLLYLHVFLDLPLLLLWVGTSMWYRQPIVAFGGYNLW